MKIAIVGGGIAGLYCAWKLAQQKHEVTLYEYKDTVGGRIETLDLEGGFKAECGPMRFELATQPMFKRLAEELHITFERFTPPVSEPAKFPGYHLEPDEMSAAHEEAIAIVEDQGFRATDAISAIFSYRTSALNLLRLGIYRILHPEPGDRNLTLRQIVEGTKEQPSKIAAYAQALRDDDYDRIRTQVTLDGRSLYQWGFWNALACVLSPGAVAKIRDGGTFYHLMPENPSASEWSIFWLRLFRGSTPLNRGEAHL